MGINALEIREVLWLPTKRSPEVISMSEWISVKERLPTSDGRYLTTVKSCYVDNYVMILNYANDLSTYTRDELQCISGWCGYSSKCGYFVYDDVVAWRELPEPYEGVNQ